MLYEVRFPRPHSRGRIEAARGVGPDGIGKRHFRDLTVAAELKRQRLLGGPVFRGNFRDLTVAAELKRGCRGC